MAIGPPFLVSVSSFVGSGVGVTVLGWTHFGSDTGGPGNYLFVAVNAFPLSGGGFNLLGITANGVAMTELSCSQTSCWEYELRNIDGSINQTILATYSDSCQVAGASLALGNVDNSSASIPQVPVSTSHTSGVDHISQVITSVPPDSVILGGVSGGGGVWRAVAPTTNPIEGDSGATPVNILMQFGSGTQTVYFGAPGTSILSTFMGNVIVKGFAAPLSAGGSGFDVWPPYAVKPLCPGTNRVTT